MIGAILAPGKRTVSAALRVMGEAHLPYYQRYHWVLNRAVWFSRLGNECEYRIGMGKGTMHWS